MKVYTLEKHFFEGWDLYGIYKDRNVARQDLQFLQEKVLGRNTEHLETTFIRVRNYMSQDESIQEFERFWDSDQKGKKKSWSEWHLNGTWNIVERDLEEFSIEDRAKSIKKWQKKNKIYTHCSGNTHIDYGGNVVLKCPHCDHLQKIPDMIKESYEASGDGASS